MFLLTALVCMGDASSQDSITLERKVSDWMKSFKENNKTVVYRYLTKDSTMVFGSNKEKTFLTSVTIYDKKNKMNTWYFYNQAGVFRIQILFRLHNKTSGKKKKVFCNYYFENDELLPLKSECPFNHLDLLNEAQRFKTMAVPYLNEGRQIQKNTTIN